MTPFEEQIREIYVKIVWTHKIQEKSADINLENHRRLKLSQIILSALTTGTILMSVFGDSKSGVIVGAVLSGILFGIEAYTKDIDLSQKANQHGKTAHSLWSIREDYLTLLVDMDSQTLNHDELVDRRNQLKMRLDDILSAAPRTGDRALARASKALTVKNDHTFTVDELDRFLPSSLHKNEGVKK